MASFAPSSAATMKLVGGDPSLDFVNTVAGRRDGGGAGARVRGDKLASYADLVDFALHAGLVTPGAGRELRRRAFAKPSEAEAALRRARAFREALHRALRALMRGRPPAAADLRELNAELGAARGLERLSVRGSRLLWDWPDSRGRLESPLHAVARSAAALVTSPELRQLGRCGGDDCGWLFLDRSRNRSRQWCTMQDCGNVSKVRRFRERQRASPTSSIRAPRSGSGRSR